MAAGRGATRLSNGRVLIERQGIAKARAEEIAELFVGAGIARSAIELSWHDDPEDPDGADDWRSRRVTVRVEPDVPWSRHAKIHACRATASRPTFCRCRNGCCDPVSASAPASRARSARSCFPTGCRRTRLYQNLVDTTLRFLIEQVGGVEGAYPQRNAASRRLPQAADGGQRHRSARHRGVPRLAGVGAGGARRRLRDGPPVDSRDRRRR